MRGCLRLEPVETAFVMAETVAARDLDETMAVFEASWDWPYSVAWIDCLARDAKLGRSLVTRGAFMTRGALPAQLAREPLRPARTSRLTAPVDAPSVLLNRASIGLFNALYYRRGRTRSGARPVHFETFFFPLDRLEAWNRLYGRRGFVQYQCVLPKAESPAGIGALLERSAAAGQGSFLAVLKLFGPGGEGLLSLLWRSISRCVRALWHCSKPSTRSPTGTAGASTLPRTPVARLNGWREAILGVRPSMRSAPRRPEFRPSSPPRFRGGSRCERLEAKIINMSPLQKTLTESRFLSSR